MIARPIRQGSPQLGAVQSLWRRHSATLGFLPTGAFDEAAERGWLLGATDDAGAFAGYLLYRVTGRLQAAIAHLCVADEFRGRGVVRVLFGALLKEIGDCTDVVVTCRRDFDVHALWPHLGFVVAGEKPAKREGAVLTTFRYAAAPLPLLARAESATDASRVRLVLDANVFIDLDERSEGEPASRALVADWLSELVELCLTEETLNEINRNEDPAERERQRRRARLFEVLTTVVADDEAVLADVRAILATGASASERSDARQVAKAIASRAAFFVTRDGDILGVADALYDRFGLEVLAPHEVILRLDEIRRADEYRPRRSFIGPDGSVESLGLDRLAEIEALLPQHGPERRARHAELVHLLAQPQTAGVICVRAGGRSIAAYSITRAEENVLSVPFFVAAADDLGPTAARHFAEHFLTVAATEGRRVVEVRPSNATAETALARARYFRAGQQWVHIALAEVGTPSELGDHVAALAEARTEVGAAHAAVRALMVQESPSAALELERSLWPAKALGTQLPCFVVPIEPKWAAELFDHDLASQGLFGANAKLILNSENAYFRAATPSVLNAPARVLWYVSRDDEFSGTMAIRACSYVDEVVTADPKTAFRRYRRLGVYRWPDVFGIANHDLSRAVQAFRFSGTEVFGSPVGFHEARARLQARGMGLQQFQSPVRVTEEAFFDIYALGHGGRRRAA